MRASILVCTPVRLAYGLVPKRRQHLTTNRLCAMANQAGWLLSQPDGDTYTEKQDDMTHLVADTPEGDVHFIKTGKDNWGMFWPETTRDSVGGVLAETEDRGFFFRERIHPDEFH